MKGGNVKRLKTILIGVMVGCFPMVSMGETLHDVATEVLNSHPDIRREQANVSSVEQARQGAIGDYLPTLDLTGAIGHETSYEKNLNGSDVN